MNLQIPSDISERLEACVLSGAYGSEKEVLREALDALDQREQEKSEPLAFRQSASHGAKPPRALKAVE